QTDVLTLRRALRTLRTHARSSTRLTAAVSHRSWATASARVTANDTPIAACTHHGIPKTTFMNRAENRVIVESAGGVPRTSRHHGFSDWAIEAIILHVDRERRERHVTGGRRLAD